MAKKTWSMPSGAILHELVGQFEGLRVAHLERRREVHLLQRACDAPRLISLRPWPALTHQRPATPSRIWRPSGGPVVHALGAGEQAGLGLEIPVGRERHPVGFEVLAGQGADARGLLNGGHGQLLRPDSTLWPGVVGLEPRNDKKS